MKNNNIFSIVPGISFLDTFVELLFEGKIIGSFNGKDNLLLSNTKIFVPTYNIAYQLNHILLKYNKYSMFAPQIIVIEEIYSNNYITNQNDKILNLSISKTEKIIILSKLIMHWSKILPKPNKINLCFDIKDIIILAKDLYYFIYSTEVKYDYWIKFQNKHISNNNIKWKMIYTFISIVIKNWPKILKEIKLNNKNYYTQFVSKIKNIDFFKFSKKYPVLSIGLIGESNFSINILKNIYKLSKGAIIISGIDNYMNKENWDNIDILDNNSMYSTNYKIKKLCNNLNITRSNIKHLGYIDKNKRNKLYLISKLLEINISYNDETFSEISKKNQDQSFNNVTFIEAQSEKDESVAIAIALSIAINKNKNIGFIPNNENLCRRVLAELKNFGIIKKMPYCFLKDTLQFKLIKLLLICIFSPSDPLIIIALLKNPLINLKRKRCKYLYLVEWIEFNILRGSNDDITIINLYKIVYNHYISHNKNKNILYDAYLLCLDIYNAINPLYKFSLINFPISIKIAVTSTIKAFENFGINEKNNLNSLYTNEYSNYIIKFFKSLMKDKSNIRFYPKEWQDILFSLIEDEKIILNEDNANEPFYIYTGVESRLKKLDTIIIGSLNENDIIKKNINNFFISYDMKKFFYYREEVNNISIHDFYILNGVNEIILSRSINKNNNLLFPFYFLKRIELYFPIQFNKMREKGNIYLNWAKQIKEKKQKLIKINPPCPKPNIKYRPLNLSVTDIITLYNNPYLIYIKKILKLKTIKPLQYSPNIVEFGKIIHSIISNIAHIDMNGKYVDIYNKILNIAKKELNNINIYGGIKTIWWNQLLKIIPNFIKWDNKLGYREKFSEVVSKKIIIDDTKINISGIADRIDIINKDYADIIEFKTGSSNINKIDNIVTQLAIEGILFMKNAFFLEKKMLNNLLYIIIDNNGNIIQRNINKKYNKTSHEICEEEYKKLKKLFIYYNNIKNGYIYKNNKNKYHIDDYDHFSRRLEWNT